MFLEEAFRRLNALQKKLDAMTSTQKAMKRSVPTASVTKQPKQYHVAKLKSDEKEHLKPLVIARRMIMTSKTETKPIKNCARSAPTAFVPKQPKQDHVAKLRSDEREDLRSLAIARRVIMNSKTETKPKKDCVRSAPTAYVPKQPKQDHVAKHRSRADKTGTRLSALLRSDEIDYLRPLANSRRVIMTLKTKTKPKQDCIVKLKSDEKEDLKPLATVRRVIMTSKTETKPRKDCVRYTPIASVPKQPKQDHVAKLRSDEREDLRPMANALRVIMTLKAKIKPKQDCVVKLRSDKKKI